MSFSPGASDQPDWVLSLRTSMLAPQPGQLNEVPVLVVPHHWQV
jgi:hypothetical protein